MSLAKKLALGTKTTLLLDRAPAALRTRLGAELGATCTVTTRANGPCDVVFAFVTAKAEVDRSAASLHKTLAPAGSLFFAYPKKSSGTATDLTRDHGWEALRARGFAPVSIVSLDETWSVLRFRHAPELLKARAARAAASKPKAKAKPAARTKPPAALASELSKDAKAAAAWAGLAPSHQREYAAWIIEAKQDATRARRVEKALAMMTKGSLNARYRTGR